VPRKTFGLTGGFFAHTGSASKRATVNQAMGLEPLYRAGVGWRGLQRYLIGAEFAAGHRLQVAQDADGL